MDSLPQELIDRICSNLDREHLKHTVLLSRKLHFASERYSGIFTKRVLTKATAQKFIDTFGGHRLLYLRELEFRPTFSPLTQKDADVKVPCRESHEELLEKDKSFTRQIEFLFATLKNVEERAEKHAPGNIQLTVYTPTRVVGERIFCLHRRYISWRVHLQDPDTLPQIASVRSFTMEHGASVNILQKINKSLLKLDPRVLIDLAVKFPNLEYLGCKIGGDDWPWAFEDEVAQHFMRQYEGPLRDARRDFAVAVKNATLPASLRRLQLDFLNPLSNTESLDQRRGMPDLLGPVRQDPFSSSIGPLIANLRHLQLKVVADESLFSNSGVSSFPNLESVEILFHPVHPSGSWYFQGPQGEGLETTGYPVTDSDYPPLEDTEEDARFDYLLDDEGDRREDSAPAEFRVAPIDEKLVPFFAAFAKAAANMPKLKQAALWSNVAWDPCELELDYEPEGIIDAPDDRQPVAFGMQYLRPGERVWFPRIGENFSKARQIWWTVGKWRPDSNLHDSFQHIGRQVHGDELIEYWDDTDTGPCLVYRSRFSHMNIMG